MTNILTKINQALFIDNFDYVSINVKDYFQYFLDQYQRFEPADENMVSNGTLGYLHGPNGELPKPVKLSKYVLPGNIECTKLY